MKILWVSLSLIGVGIAWFLGSRLNQKEELPSKSKLPRDYLTGLNFLLNEETDKAVDIFIKMLEVDSETVETHLAVGKLFRKRGEVDRAIRIHQNLIARPQLEKIYREQSLFELGQDYLSAGMLDRAERIFLDLINEKSHAAQALKILIDIYQQEKSWERAIQTANQYQTVTRINMQPVIAHYYCELAEFVYHKPLPDQTLDYLDKALSADKACVRASLLLAKVRIKACEYQLALEQLKKIKDQNIHYFSEAIELLAACYEQLEQKDELIHYLESLADQYPHVPIVLILAEKIRRWKGETTATHFVADYVRRYPTLKGFALFINLYLSSAEDKIKEELHILQNLMKRILANKPDYQCHSCGFAGKSLHWQCPGCKQWSTMLPMHSLSHETV